MRQALAGMLWSKQYFGFDLHKWLVEHGVDSMRPDQKTMRNIFFVPLFPLPHVIHDIRPHEFAAAQAYWHFCQSRVFPARSRNLRQSVWAARLSSAQPRVGIGAWRRAHKVTVRYTLAVTLAALALTLLSWAQDEIPIFKTEAASAFVWGEENSSGAVSSSVRDPVTGNAIHKLHHGGIEVSSRAGFERVDSGGAGELLSFTTTIVNNTDSELSVRHGGASVNGRVALPLPVVLTMKGLGKRERKQVWKLDSMNCFSSGFLPNQAFFSPNASSKVWTVAPKETLTVSFVIRDPHYNSVLCSVEGCYPKGTTRFSVTVNATDFVFIWPGRAMVYCGK